MFTGWFDPPIVEEGWEGARRAGKWLKEAHLEFSQIFESDLKRTQQTTDGILQGMGLSRNGLLITRAQEIKERDYGELSQKNKDEIRAQFGEEKFLEWRRSFEGRPPKGESLKDTVDRVIPFFEKEILPLAAAGKNVLVSAHGNSLRAIIMDLDQLSGEEIAKVEIPWTIPIIYEINSEGKAVERWVLGYSFLKGYQKV